MVLNESEIDQLHEEFNRLQKSKRECSLKQDEILRRLGESARLQQCKSLEDVIAIMEDPATADLFVEEAEALLIEDPFNELESSVWDYVRPFLPNEDDVSDIDSEYAYSVVRRAIGRATADWDN